MPLEYVEIDIRAKILTHTRHLPLDTGSLGTAIAEAINERMPHPGDVIECVSVDIDGDTVYLDPRGDH